MISIFETLTAAMTQSPLIALAASLVWGVLSILLSPCHLSSIPLIIGVITAEKETSKKHAFFYIPLLCLGNTCHNSWNWRDNISCRDAHGRHWKLANPLSRCCSHLYRASPPRYFPNSYIALS